MATYNLWTKFNATDGVTPKFVSMGKAAFAASRKMNKSFSKTNSVLAGNVLATGVTRGLGMVRQGVSSLVREYASFDDAIVSSAAKFKDVNVATDEGRKKLEALRKTAKLAGQESIFTTTQSAKGLEFLAMAGFTSAQAIASLSTIQNLAIATNTEFAQAADMSSDLLGAFGLASKDAAVQAKNFTRLNDVLTKTANSANVDLTAMFETMKVAGPISKAYGASLEEVAAITGVLGNAGIKGSMGATALKNIMLRMAAPTKKAQAMMDELKISTGDADGNMRKITDILQEVGEKTANLGSKKKLEAMNALFGKIPIAAAASLSTSIGSIKELEKSLISAGGTSKLTAEQMSKSLGNKLKALGSAVEAFAFKFFDAFAKDGVDGITIFTNAIKKFDVKPIISGLKFVFGVISDLMPLIKVIIPLWVTWTALQWLLNAALSANPIGLIVIGVAALAAGIILVIKHWDLLKNGFVKGTKVVGKAIFDWIVAPFELVLLLMSKIPGLKTVGSSGLEQIDSARNKMFGENFDIDSILGDKTLDGEERKVEAPNAAKEQGKSLRDQLDLMIRSEKGTSVEVEKNTSSNVNVKDLGIN